METHLHAAQYPPTPNPAPAPALAAFALATTMSHRCATPFSSRTFRAVSGDLHSWGVGGWGGWGGMWVRAFVRMFFKGGGMLRGRILTEA